ncbi:hypothetical protein PVPAM_110065100 [Plasmodium vivax]|nr:hypothetical protein PVPAM_110065100 [Plasmodium vivax]
MYNMSPLEHQDHIAHQDTLSCANNLNQKKPLEKQNNYKENHILHFEPSLEEEEDTQMEYTVVSMDNSQKDFHDMKNIMRKFWTRSNKYIFQAE